MFDIIVGLDPSSCQSEFDGLCAVGAVSAQPTSCHAESGSGFLMGFLYIKHANNPKTLDRIGASYPSLIEGKGLQINVLHSHVHMH